MSSQTKDLSNLNSVDLNSENAGEAFSHALKEYGFAELTNHRVPTDTLPDIINEWKGFFASQDKFNWLRTDETDEGFIPINVETANKGELADYKELYQTHFNGMLPSNINSDLTVTYFTSIVKLGERLSALLDNSLPTEVKSQIPSPLHSIVEDCQNHLLRVIHYPPIKPGIHIPRAAPHTDICIFTLIPGQTFSGLELQSNNGDWFEPVVNKDSMIVFASEMLELATNSYIKAVPHRVKANPNSYTDSRYSIPMGFHPKRKAELQKGLTAIAHLKKRLNEMGYDGDSLNEKDY